MHKREQFFFALHKNGGTVGFCMAKTGPDRVLQSKICNCFFCLTKTGPVSFCNTKTGVWVFAMQKLGNLLFEKKTSYHNFQ